MTSIIPSMYDNLKKAADSYPDNTAIVYFGKKILYARYVDLIDRAAAGLKKLGIGRGDTVTLCMPNTPSSAIAFYAINRLGAIVNLVHPFSPPHQILAAIQKTASKLLIAYDIYLGKNTGTDYGIPVLKSRIDYFMPSLIACFYRAKNKKMLKHKTTAFETLFDEHPIDEPPQKFDEYDRAIFLPSGGTTSEPKIVMHTNKVFNDLCAHAQFFLSEPIKNYDAMYSVLPIFHGFGLCMNMHMSALNGVTNIMTPKFSAKAMAKSIKKDKVNILTGVPMMYQKLLDCKQFRAADLSSIKDCFVGGDSASNKLINEFNDALKKGGSKAKLFQGYGLTEAISVCTVERVGENALGSVGVGVPGSKIKIFETMHDAQCTMHNEGQVLIKDVNNSSIINHTPSFSQSSIKTSDSVGEIIIASPYLMLGYLGGEDSPIKEIDGERWLFTGDYGYIKDGLLYFKQRMKSMIKVAGVPVFPCEVEEVAVRIDGVSAAAAIGVKDSELGEVVKLFVEYGGSDDGIEDRIRAVCEESLIKYAVPKEIVIKENLPKTAIGKVDKKGLE